jgi:DNA gyrase subunit A
MTKTNIVQVGLVQEMKSAYLDYSMAVLVGRAIPDLYDGLKPVTRRIMTAMKALNLRPDGRYMKCARVEGETTGKYHPHGGAYGAMVTAAAWWTNNHPLIDIHGNGGSPTDNAAAPRYTEAKVSQFAWDVLLQDSDTWTTRPNYDGSLQEPVQLNARLPLVLLNGSEGIGVGFATKIPAHNLRGVSKALRALADEDILTAKNALAPDFPTGCHIVKDEGLVEYLNEGVGSIRMRAHCSEETIDYGKKSKRTALVFTNLPLYTNTEQVGEQIKEGIEKGKVTTVADVRDETDRSGIRLVVVLKASADIPRARAEIFKNTSLDTKFSARNLVIDNLKPVQLAPHDMLIRWAGWRDQRLLASLKAELEKRRGRLEVVQGLITAITLIDEVILQIRAAKDRADAKSRLVGLQFTEKQADAILDMRLAQLTKLDDKQLQQEAKETQARIKEILALTSSEKKRKEYIIQEVEELAERHGNARRSEAIESPNEVAVETIKVEGRKVQVAQSGPRMRYVLVDEDKGILTQLKAPRGAKFVIPDDQKMVFVCDNGHFYKVNARHRGPLSDSPTKILLRGSTTNLPQDPIVAVWKTTEGVFANVIPWEDLLRTTSKGKRWMPEDAELLHVGTSPYELKYQSSRKKPKVLSAKTLKARPVQGKGNKVAKVEEIVV